MIFFLYGPDNFRSRQKLNYYKEGFIKKYDQSGFNIVILEGKGLDFEELKRTITSPAFLASKKMVIIENLISENKDVSRETADFISGEKDNANVIIFWEGKEKASKEKRKEKEETNPLAKKLLKEATAEKFELLAANELVKWVHSEVKKRGGIIDTAAAQNLVALVEDDLWQMSGEIDKLIAYKQKEKITSADVSLFVRGKFDDDIFRLTDALAHRNKKLFLKLLADQFSSGTNEIYLLTMFVRLFRILLEIKDASGSSSHPSKFTLAEKLGLHPFVVQKSLEQVNNYSLADLKKIYQKLLDIDFKIKTGQAKGRLLFELLAVGV